jgi:hypothetical protein
MTLQVAPPSAVRSKRSGAYQSRVEMIARCGNCGSTLMPPAIPPQFAAAGVTLVQVLPANFQICPVRVTPLVL